jgi:hypothetical protein
MGVARDPQSKGGRVVPVLDRRLAVIARQRDESLGRPEDREVHVQAEASGPLDAGRGAADRDPHRKPRLYWARVDAGGVQRRTEAPRPGDPLRLPQLEQQVELLLKERVIVVEVVAEERERLDVCPASRCDLGPSVGEHVDGGEVLEHPHRIRRGQHCHRAREPDAAGGLRDRAQHDCRRGDGEVGTVVLSDAEDVEPRPVGQDREIDELAHADGRGQQPSRRRIGGQLAEGEEAELEILGAVALSHAHNDS